MFASCLILLLSLLCVFGQNITLQSGVTQTGSINPLQTLSFELQLSQYTGLMVEIAGYSSSVDFVSARLEPITTLSNLSPNTGILEAATSDFDGMQTTGFVCPVDLMPGQNVTALLASNADFSLPYSFRMTNYDPSLNDGRVYEGVFCCQERNNPSSMIWSYDVRQGFERVVIALEYTTENPTLISPRLLIQANACPTRNDFGLEFDIDTSLPVNFFEINPNEITGGDTIYLSISQPLSEQVGDGNENIRIVVCVDEECDTVTQNPFSTASSSAPRRFYFGFLTTAFLAIALFLF